MSNLNGIQFYADNTLDDVITTNLVTFFKYGLLELGAYYNVNISNSGSILRPAVINGTSNYKIYRGIKDDWIWESGINFKATGLTQPIQISGILVNNIFYPTGTLVTGTGYYIDYSQGRVVFNHPLSANHVVKCPYSLRYVQVYEQDSSVYRKINFDWANTTATGLWNDNEFRAYLPAIFVKVRGYETIKGKELGTRAKDSNAIIEFNIFSENSADDRRLSNICYMLETKHPTFYDVQNAPYPLTSSGTINPSGLTYPNLISQYPYSDVPRFAEDCRVTHINTILPIYHSKASLSLRMFLYPT